MALTRRKLQLLAEDYLTAAAALNVNGLYGPAYYLAGLAVECAIKACIAKRVAQYSFPDKALAEESWKHDLKRLFDAAKLWSGFESDLRTHLPLRTNWDVVKVWTIDSRYRKTKRTTARDMLRAVREPPSGVILWVKSRW